MTFQITSDAQRIVEQLPIELQCVLVENVLFNFLTENKEFVDECHVEQQLVLEKFHIQNLLRRPLRCIHLLFDYDKLLDMILVNVIKELVFDSKIISSPSFSAFTKFIRRKSIKIDIVLTEEITLDFDSVAPFFKECCRKIDADYRMIYELHDPRYLTYVTSLTCHPHVLQTIFNRIKLPSMLRLTELKIVIDADSLVHLTYLPMTIYFRRLRTGGRL
ncbi:unnamed protein product [Ambrosiozyma monospora]|uniref:Unnamed protein product n=1 Tax=Ambrosiozyma monospora TaxID=43982 RepID=A0ACB5SRT5_AMBMO|nr:unnamed protein product [Ambrosiozyma monospora]